MAVAKWKPTIIALGMLASFCSVGIGEDTYAGLDRYAHNAWTPQNSALRSSVQTIAQTRDGYLWLGTESALIRFDGVRMAPWMPPRGQELPPGPVEVLYAGHDGTLWIGTYGGLASWKDGRLTPYPALSKTVILALFEDREGTLWVGTLEFPTAKVCAVRNGGVTCDDENGNLGNGVISFNEDGDGNLWAGAASGLWRWRPGTPTRYLSNPFSDGLSMAPGDHGSGLTVVLDRGIVRQIVAGKLIDYPLAGVPSPLTAKHLLRDRRGGLWIGTDSHGLVYSYQGKSRLFTHNDGLSSDQVNALLEDREGTVWAATSEGLDSFRELPVPSLSATEGLSSNTVGAVLAARDGSVWIGTRTGVNRWKDGLIRTYTTRNNPGLPDDQIGSLFEDERGRIWVSTEHGLAVFEDGRFTVIPSVPPGQINSIAGDQKGGLWLSLARDSREGLAHLVNGKLTERMPWAQVGGTPGSGLVPDQDGGVWTGLLDGGIVHFRAGHIEKLPLNGAGSGARIFNIYRGHDGALWAAGEGGLNRIANGRVSTLTIANGLPCNAVHWIIEDDRSSYWVYTRCGLLRIAQSDLDSWVADPKHKIQTTIFDGADGVQLVPLPSPFRPHVTKSSDGKIWFQNGNKVGMIDPSRMAGNALPPPVHIEQITADGKTYEAAAGLHLPPRVRNIAIEYTALSLVAPDKVRFRYKLEPQDPDWRELTNDRKVQYSNLGPGAYHFRLIASNNSGVWNETGDVLEFAIAPAYYQTHWFHAGVATFCYALLFVLYRRRLRRIAHEYNVRLEERVEERSRIARDLHDTLLQTFQGLMLRFQVVDELLPPGRAKDELEATLECGDQAVVEARNAVHDLRSSATTTNDLAYALRALGDELAGDATGTFRLVVEGRARDLNPIVRDEIYRIAREALRNVVTHSGASRIEAEIIYEEQGIRLRVRDDGKGIPPEILDQGRAGHYGLTGMRERARSIGAKLTISSGEGIGTEVNVTVPAAIAYGKPPAWSRFLPFRRIAG